MSWNWMVPTTATSFPCSKMGMRLQIISWPRIFWTWAISATPVLATMCMRVFSITSVTWRPTMASAGRPRNSA